MKIKSLYIASLEASSGSLIISMGLMELLKSRYEKVAFFRPVIKSEKRVDSDIDFMLKHFSLDLEYKKSYGFTVDDIETAVSEGKLSEILEKLIRNFRRLEKSYDFVLIEGMPQSLFSTAIDFDVNLMLAKNFRSPFVAVLKGVEKSANEIYDEIRLEGKAIREGKVSHFATFVNRVDEKKIEALNKKLKKRKYDYQIYMLPEVEELDCPTVKEIKGSLTCVKTYGQENNMLQIVKQSKIAAMSVENYLKRLEDGDLIIVPGDRADIILASMMSFYTKTSPNISGLILTGGIKPDEKVMQLIQDFHEIPLPIIEVECDTYATAKIIQNIKAKITPESERKISLAMGLFSTNVNSERIAKTFDIESSNVVTPMMFEYGLFERARQDRKRIVLPESSDERVLRAAEVLLRRDVVDLILLGNVDEIEHKCSLLGVDISKAELINPQNSPLMEKYSKIFYELRKDKGLMIEAAQDAMNHWTYFATMMVYTGDADGMVSGAIHTTGETIRPALQTIKTKEGISIVSSVFFMCLETRVLVYGDCAVNQDPDYEQLAEIAISSADTAKTFGIEPRIAMLSYSTGSSGKGKEVDKVRKATKIVKERRPDLLVEGPIQYDAAIDENVAKSKLPDSEVAGRATVFIFPDLNTGNNTYKAVQRSSKSIAIGPVLQGLKKPINDLSRGCLVEDIVNTVAITAIQAQEPTDE